MKPEIEILRKARELIAKPENWTQGIPARNAEGMEVPSRSESAVCWCLFGATEAVTPEEAWGRLPTVWQILDVCANSDGGFIHYNDAPERTHADVLALLGRAIEIAEKNEVRT